MPDPIRLHLGCGDKYIPGYVHIDAKSFKHVDVVMDVTLISKLYRRTVDAIYACHVLEHIDRRGIDAVLEEWCLVLRDNGVIRISVPDFDAVVDHYRETGDLDSVMGLLYGGQTDSLDYHRVGFTFESLRLRLEKVGFTAVSRYDANEFLPKEFDDYSKAYLPHMDPTGRLMSLNVMATKAPVVRPSPVTAPKITVSSRAYGWLYANPTLARLASLAWDSPPILDYSPNHPTPPDIIVRASSGPETCTHSDTEAKMLITFNTEGHAKVVTRPPASIPDLQIIGHTALSGPGILYHSCCANHLCSGNFSASKLRQHTNNFQREYLAAFCYSYEVPERTAMFRALHRLHPASVRAIGAANNTVQGTIPPRAMGAIHPDLISEYSKYRFVFAMENRSVSGYITEKILNAYAAGAVPIFWGDSSTAKRLFNPESFLDVSDYNTPAEAAEAIIALDANPAAYHRMATAPIFPNGIPPLFDPHAHLDDLPTDWQDAVALMRKRIVSNKVETSPHLSQKK